MAVVCGYGCDINSPLRPYLDRVGEFLRVNNIEAVILCGGETRKATFPGKSEARVMYDYLRITANHSADFVIEDKSYTTYDNIRLAADRIRRMRPRGREDIKFKITIFCESQRDLAVEIAARYFMRNLVADVEGDIRTETVSWERLHPSKALFKANMMWLAIKFPWLGIADRERYRRIERSWRI